MFNQPLFLTERLIIRNLRVSDLSSFHFYRSNPDVTRYQGFDVFTKEMAEAFIEEHRVKKFIQPGEWIQFGIEVKKSMELVGDCAIFLSASDSRLAETGITISHLHHRKGYGTEVMQGMIDFLFREKGVHRITETVDAENIASIQMLRNLHFREEGYFIENVFFKGRWGSEYRFAMLRQEWERRFL